MNRQSLPSKKCLPKKSKDSNVGVITPSSSVPKVPNNGAKQAAKIGPTRRLSVFPGIVQPREAPNVSGRVLKRRATVALSDPTQNGPKRRASVLPGSASLNEPSKTPSVGLQEAAQAVTTRRSNIAPENVCLREAVKAANNEPKRRATIVDNYPKKIGATRRSSVMPKTSETQVLNGLSEVVPKRHSTGLPGPEHSWEPAKIRTTRRSTLVPGTSSSGSVPAKVLTVKNENFSRPNENVKPSTQASNQTKKIRKPAVGTKGKVVKSVGQQQSGNGCERNAQVEQIVGVMKVKGILTFYIVFEDSDVIEKVPAKTAYQKIPQEVIKYYEKHVTFS